MARTVRVSVFLVLLSSCTLLRTSEDDLELHGHGLGFTRSDLDAVIRGELAGDRAQAYAARSVMNARVVRAWPATTGLAGTALSDQPGWVLLVPIGLVYDIVMWPTFLVAHLGVSEGQVEQASRDIDAARRLGYERDYFEMGSGAVSSIHIDRTNHYESADG